MADFLKCAVLFVCLLFMVLVPGPLVCIYQTIRAIIREPATIIDQLIIMVEIIFFAGPMLLWRNFQRFVALTYPPKRLGRWV